MQFHCFSVLFYSGMVLESSSKLRPPLLITHILGLGVTLPPIEAPLASCHIITHMGTWHRPRYGNILGKQLHRRAWSSNKWRGSSVRGKCQLWNIEFWREVEAEEIIADLSTDQKSKLIDIHFNSSKQRGGAIFPSRIASFEKFDIFHIFLFIYFIWRENTAFKKIILEVSMKIVAISHIFLP